ncbi:MAG: hypothetical protein LBQ49_00075 [Rickettsiales bacterium]|jgi:hypothetical protein|nr:hypothetical protein [Rickettsiales bacterium]
MKKSMILLPLALVACTGYHNGKIGAVIAPIPPIESKIEANVKVGEKITGSAECTEVLFLTVSAPERQTYGPELQTKTGNLANSTCTAGAIYDAMSSSDADIIVSPQYTSVKTSFGCIPFVGCLYKNTKVIVSGHAGKITYAK